MCVYLDMYIYTKLLLYYNLAVQVVLALDEIIFSCVLCSRSITTGRQLV